MKASTYKTLEAPAEGVYKEKGSKFLAFAFPVESEDDVKRRLAELRRRFHDARHVCYAYRLGKKEPFRERANDDGEPAKSAGIPILGQIRKYDLTDTLVAVVRYFGGVKLGVGGLKRAYKTAADDALKNAAFAERPVTEMVRMRFPYEKLDLLLKILKGSPWEMQTPSDGGDPLIVARVPEETARLLRRRFPEAFTHTSTDDSN